MQGQPGKRAKSSFCAAQGIFRKISHLILFVFIFEPMNFAYPDGFYIRNSFSLA
jgi:hypothetical protein